MEKHQKPNSRSSSSRKKKQQQEQEEQPLKVVYIGNPIRFETSASEFRALVQGLTGQDAPSFFGPAGVADEQEGGATDAVEMVQNGSGPSAWRECNDFFYQDLGEALKVLK